MRPIKKRKILLAKLADILGRFLFIFHRKPSDNPIDLSKVKSILVMELFNIGDVILSLPALHELRKLCPNAKITFLGGPWSEKLLKHNHNVDEIITITVPWVDRKSSWRKTWNKTRELKKRHYDVGIDLRGDFRNIIFLYLTCARERIASASTGGKYLLTRVVPEEIKPLHDVEHKLSAVRILGNTQEKLDFDFTVSLESAKNALDDLKSKGITDSDIVIGVHVGGRWYGRRWQPERFAKVIDTISENKNIKFVLVGSNEDREIIAKIAGLIKIPIIQIYSSLDQLPAYLKQCDLFLCNESGPMHFAAALGIPVIVLFGPNLPDILGPYGEGHKIIMALDVPCRPCTQTVCIRPELWCMDLISTEEVIHTLETKLLNLQKDTQ